MISASQQTLSGTCGAGLLYNFRHGYGYYDHNLETSDPPGGAGWLCAGFIRNNTCKEAYETLKKRYKIVLQTPVRRNSNSGNGFFFLVYDTKKPRWVGKSKGAPQPVWDVSGNDQYSWPWK